MIGGQKTADQAPRVPFRPDDSFDFNRLNDRRSMEMPFQSRYFWVKYDEAGTAAMTDVSHIASITEEDAAEYAASVYGGKRVKGFLHSFRYLISSRDDGSTLVIFVDMSSKLIDVYKLLFQSLLVGAFAIIAMFVLVYIFSGQAVAPVVESLV